MPVDNLPELSTTAAWREAMRSARKRLGFTQGSLAERVRVSQALISGIEKGLIGQSTAVHKICEVLKIAPPMPGVDAGGYAELAKFSELRERYPEQFRGLLAAVEAMIGDQGASRDPLPTMARDRKK